MSLVLNHVVQAQCPSCQNTLRIPANWVSEPMKCKHCGLVFQAKPPKEKKRRIHNAIAAMTRLGGKLKGKKKRKKDKSAPGASVPIGRPAGVPTAQPVLPGAQAAVPVAKPVGSAGITPAPVAMPVGGKLSPAAPMLLNGTAPIRRRRGSWAKLAFVFIFLLGVGSLAAVVHHLNPGIFDVEDEGQVAEGDGSEPTNPETPTKAEETKPAGTKPVGVFQTSAPRKTETTRKLFDPIVTRATQPRFTYPVRTQPIITRPVGQPNPMPINPNQPNPTRPQPNDPDTRQEPPKVNVPIVDAGKGFPRALLAISINNYPYANPVNYGGNGAKAFDQIARQFAEVMRIPQDRVTILSDRAPVPLPPTRSLVQSAFEQFLAGARPMDRIAILFVGHGVEIDGKAYLVPLLGEPTDDKSLLPLDWVYSKLAGCPAQEKLLILDTCRFDLQRGEERGAVAKMSEGFEAALQKPPKGVQVITACGANEYSWEVENNQTLKIEGGVFLNSVAVIKDEGGLRGVEHKQDGPLPITELFNAMRLRTGPKVKAYLKQEQTPKLFGDKSDKAVAFDPKVATPKQIALKLDEKEFKGGISTSGDIQPFLDLVNKVPPIKQGDRSGMRADSFPPYPKDDLKNYKDDKKDSDFRAFVREGVDVLVKHNGAFRETRPALPENMQQKAQIFNQLTQEQQNLALVFNDLEGKYVELKSLNEQRGMENKLWQANYDFIRARILFRMAYFYEYNAMLAKIRKEELPELDKQVHQGYKLAAKATMSDRDAQKIADDAKKILKKLAEEHKGTPWELIAKREMATSLGLDWAPY